MKLDETEPTNEARGLTLRDHPYLDLLTTLEAHGLPSEGVLVPVSERQKLFRNLDDVVRLLPADVRAKAVYISKSVAACAVGLFDAALNYLWDETIANLREKVARFDLEYFYDSTITDTARRKQLTTVDDLSKIDDWEFIKGCHKIGIVSDLGYKQLDYIRDMRNWASAAHPNHNEVTGLQLVTWMETCIREVFAREPEAPAIEVRQLLANIRTKALKGSDAAPINASIDRLPQSLAAALLRAVFGMYTDPDIAAQAKNNIDLIAPALWLRVPEESRREVGIRFATFSVNGDVPRRDAARSFLQVVGGLSYLPADTVVAEFEEKVTNLEAAHEGMNNFYNEPAPAKALLALVPANGSIPDGIRTRYVKVLVRAAIGNGFGVSRAAVSYYQELIQRFREPEIIEFAKLLADPDMAGRLDGARTAERFQDIALELLARTSDTTVQQVLEQVTVVPPREIRLLTRTTKMREALSALG